MLKTESLFWPILEFRNIDSQDLWRSTRFTTMVFLLLSFNITPLAPKISWHTGIHSPISCTAYHCDRTNHTTVSVQSTMYVVKAAIPAAFNFRQPYFSFTIFCMPKSTMSKPLLLRRRKAVTHMYKIATWIQPSARAHWKCLSGKLVTSFHRVF